MEVTIPRARGPYSRHDSLASLDRRTKEARLVEKTRADLAAHVGGAPSPTQAALIEAAAWLRLRISMMDQKFAETGQQSEHDSRTYLAWVGTLGRTMTRLDNLKGSSAKPPTPSLTSYLADRAAGKAAA